MSRDQPDPPLLPLTGACLFFLGAGAGAAGTFRGGAFTLGGLTLCVFDDAGEGTDVGSGVGEMAGNVGGTPPLVDSVCVALALAWRPSTIPAIATIVAVPVAARAPRAGCVLVIPGLW
jgi:hypothetical protein